MIKGAVKNAFSQAAKKTLTAPSEHSDDTTVTYFYVLCELEIKRNEL